MVAMTYTGYGILFIFIFFSLILFFVAFGNFVGKRNPGASSGLSVTEGAIFTLMALLVAFTFSNAAQRFDYRRALMIQESNAISTAYLRTQTLKSDDAILLKKDFVSYVHSRIAIYEAFPDINLINLKLKESQKIQQILWHDAVAACARSSQTTCSMLILPPINTMFDLAHERMSYSYIHPSILIFALLILVSLFASFLTGYGISKKGSWHSVHVIIYAIIVTLTVYTIIDLEAPRYGLIKESGFDYLLKDMKQLIETP